MEPEHVPDVDLVVRLRRSPNGVVLEKLGMSWEVNDVGALVWQLMDGKRSLLEVSRLVAAEYPDQSADVVLDDVLDLVTAFVEAGLATVTSP